MKAEEQIYSATDYANLDDDVDDDLTLIDLARRAMAQARSNAPWVPITNSPADDGDDEKDEETEVVGQEVVLKVI